MRSTTQRSAEPGAVLGLAAGDHGSDAARRGAGGGTCRGRSRGRRSARRVAARPADWPATGGTRSSSGISCVTSLRLPPVSDQASGSPVASTRRWCLEPAASVDRARARFGAPFFAWTWLPVDDRARPVDLTRRLQPRQQQRVQLLPHPGLLPLLQPPPTGEPRTEAELLRQVLPRDPGLQHKQDPLQRLPIRQPLRPGYRKRRSAFGNNGSTSSHNSSETSHGGRRHRHPSQLDDRCRRDSSSAHRSLHSAMSSKRSLRPRS